jgi:hypothetical protein
MATSEGEKQTCWYVMRDLKRANAKLPAYKQLLNEHFEVFTAHPINQGENSLIL